MACVKHLFHWFRPRSACNRSRAQSFVSDVYETIGLCGCSSVPACRVENFVMGCLKCFREPRPSRRKADIYQAGWPEPVPIQSGLGLPLSSLPICAHSADVSHFAVSGLQYSGPGQLKLSSVQRSCYHRARDFAVVPEAQRHAQPWDILFLVS